MSRHRDGGSPVRRQLTVWGGCVVAVFLLGSFGPSYQQTVSARGADDEESILQAGQVSSTSTTTDVTITVKAPNRQPPGVLYTVARSTPKGEAVVCSGAAPLVCKDPIGTSGAEVNYTVVSSLQGRGEATIALDASTEPRPSRTTTPRRSSSTSGTATTTAQRTRTRTRTSSEDDSEHPTSTSSSTSGSSATPSPTSSATTTPTPTDASPTGTPTTTPPGPIATPPEPGRPGKPGSSTSSTSSASDATSPSDTPGRSGG